MSKKQESQITDEDFQQYIRDGLVSNIGWRSSSKRKPREWPSTDLLDVDDKVFLIGRRIEDHIAPHTAQNSEQGIDVVWRISPKASTIVARELLFYLGKEADAKLVTRNDDAGERVKEVCVFMKGEEADIFKMNNPELPKIGRRL
jgi:hypothetical protein